jgi:hypothetical protein
MTTRWEHVHQCRKCGNVVPIDDIDPRVITAGVITCPKCEACICNMFGSACIAGYVQPVFLAKEPLRLHALFIGYESISWRRQT